MVVVRVIVQAKTVLALWRAVGELTGRIDNGLGAVHGLGLSEFMVLHLLAQAPGQSMRRVDLADAMGRTASGVTRMLMPMEKTGLVLKQRNPRDARSSLVKLSKGGGRIYAEAAVSFDEMSSQQLRRLNKGQVSDLQKLAQILVS